MQGDLVVSDHFDALDIFRAIARFRARDGDSLLTGSIDITASPLVITASELAPIQWRAILDAAVAIMETKRSYSCDNPR